MKKLIIASSFAVLAAQAQAHELTVRAGQNFGSNHNTAGVALATQVQPKLSVELAADAFTNHKEVVGRWTAAAAYDVATYKQAVFTAKAGLSFIDREANSNGFAGVVGVGVSYPVMKNVRAVADYQYQHGQSRVSALDGNIITAGFRVQF